MQVTIKGHFLYIIRSYIHISVISCIHLYNVFQRYLQVTIKGHFLYIIYKKKIFDRRPTDPRLTVNSPVPTAYDFVSEIQICAWVKIMPMTH